MFPVRRSQAYHCPFCMRAANLPWSATKFSPLKKVSSPVLRSVVMFHSNCPVVKLPAMIRYPMFTPVPVELIPAVTTATPTSKSATPRLLNGQVMLLSIRCVKLSTVVRPDAPASVEPPLFWMVQLIKRYWADAPDPMDCTLKTLELAYNVAPETPDGRPVTFTSSTPVHGSYFRMRPPLMATKYTVLAARAEAPGTSSFCIMYSTMLGSDSPVPRGRSQLSSPVRMS